MTVRPATCPAWQAARAAAASPSGNELATDAEPAGLEQARGSREGGAAVDGCAGHLSAVVAGGEVSDRDHLRRVPGQLDELGDDARAGDVERRVDAVRRQRADALDQFVPVGDGLPGFDADDVQDALGGLDRDGVAGGFLEGTTRQA